MGFGCRFADFHAGWRYALHLSVAVGKEGRGRESWVKRQAVHTCRSGSPYGQVALENWNQHQLHKLPRVLYNSCGSFFVAHQSLKIAGHKYILLILINQANKKRSSKDLQPKRMPYNRALNFQYRIFFMYSVIL